MQYTGCSPACKTQTCKMQVLLNLVCEACCVCLLAETGGEQLGGHERSPPLSQWKGVAMQTCRSEGHAACLLCRVMSCRI
jgi:hypothetical protein